MAFPSHVLVSPLNWGLGHATRCIPLINYFLQQGSKVSIASDGNALQLLKDEFPDLHSLELNSSQVTYSASGVFFYLKLMLQSGGLKKRAKQDEHLVDRYIQKHQVDLLVSDHRFGAFSENIKSVIISHQLQFKAGLFSVGSSYLNAKYHNRYDEVWVPDTDTKPDLSGVLSQSRWVKVPVKKIGVLSRFSKLNLAHDIDYLAVISGPEPLRAQFEEKILESFSRLTSKTCVIVRGVYNQTDLENLPHLRIFNHLKSKELNHLISRAKLVICRSGYSSVMDMASLGKKVFFVPTPHQGEQEYLAQRLEKQKIAPFSSQKKFETTDLKNIRLYSGFNSEGLHRFPLPGFRQTLEA
ncbi:glycosyltransferase [Psychroflexus sediminis]|uniref:Glycosyl transferase family 1 n=1 Tax=Psychroflexus sediminis TaxID=470826 RepID=A0A1G7XY62_9FLAO|nr:glycosyltransferase [Psychroflexus sediminis]SDG88976.1 Glycosyl transferase family 1 [Psychroflexus sediminis]